VDTWGDFHQCDSYDVINERRIEASYPVTNSYLAPTVSTCPASVFFTQDGVCATQLVGKCQTNLGIRRMVVQRRSPYESLISWPLEVPSRSESTPPAAATYRYRIVGYNNSNQEVPPQRMNNHNIGGDADGLPPDGWELRAFVTLGVILLVTAMETA